MRRRRRMRPGAAVLVAVALAVAGSVATSCTTPSAPTAQEASATTAAVERGTLSATVTVSGTLTHRARADGSPYPAINQARGTYTALPEVGQQIGCGAELYRVDDEPVLLLCGTLPAYRDLRAGDRGNDVRQLNANLHLLGLDVGTGVDIDPGDDTFTERTAKALEQLHHDTGARATGELPMGGAVFLPEPVRVAAVAGQLGGPAQPGTPVLDATSAVLEVQVALEGSQQGSVASGNTAQVVLPSNRSVAGVVERVGTVAQASGGPNEPAGPAAIPASIGLDDPNQVRGLDHAPVRVEIATQGVEDVLSVPVTSIVGRSGGGFAVEVVRDDGSHELVAVALGLTDTTAGRVQVDGEVRQGDLVVVPGA